MNVFFAPFSLKGLALPNRSVRSAVWEGMADAAGRATPRLIETLTALARNRVGLIITGHAFVDPAGRAGPWQLGVDDDDLIEGLAGLTRSVHNAGGRVCLQLAHAGGHAAGHLSGLPAVGPSMFEGRFGAKCGAMSAEDVVAVRAAMANGARRAKAAGFDAVQIHAAHGYLLSQFLSPATNRRQDRYGGKLENRARLVCKAVQAVRQAVGEAFPVLIKLNSEDFTDGGFQPEEMLQVSAWLVEAGVDAVEMSGGLVTNPHETHCARKVHPADPREEGYYRQAARAFKAALDLPLILVGGIRTLARAEELLVEGCADLIAFGRPLISEPGLIRRWQAGDDRPAACLSCNRCYVPLQAGQGVACVMQRERHQRRPSR